MYSMIVIQDLLVLVLHLEQQSSVRTELPHNLNVSDKVNIVNVNNSSTNATGVGNSGYNGTFEVTAVTNDKEFQYTTTDTDGKLHTMW